MPLRHGSHPSFAGQLVVLDNDARLRPEIHFVQATVDFGCADGGENDMTVVTVPAPWVSAASVIVCSPVAVATPDHDPEDVALEALNAYASNIVAGVSFDIIASAPRETWGRYVINAMG